MANEKNLKKGKATQFKSGEQAVKNGRKGGRKSARVRAEKRTIQAILTEFLKTPCSDMPQMEHLADKLGIESKKSKKELFAIVCLMNTLKKGTVDDIGKVAALLGERTEYDDNNGKAEETLAKIRECAFDDRDKP